MDKAKTDEIIRLISEDGESLRGAAKIVGVAYSTAAMWVNSPEYADQYARAREDRGLVLAEETIEIADRSDLDPQDKRVRIDARKWFASKLSPKILGDRQQHDHTHTGDLTVKSDAELESRLAELLGKTGAVGAAGGKGAPDEDSRS